MYQHNIKENLNTKFKIVMIFILLFNLSCATLLPTEKRIYSETVEYKKSQDSWKKAVSSWVSTRFGERGLSTKKEEKDILSFVLGMGYDPKKTLPTVGSCHFILNVEYANNALNLHFENIFFVNGYGRVGTTARMHDGESGPNNEQELNPYHV